MDLYRSFYVDKTDVMALRISMISEIIRPSALHLHVAIPIKFDDIRSYNFLKRMLVYTKSLLFYLHSKRSWNQLS